MPVKIISDLGWEHCAHLASDHAELLVTLDVGPRILQFALAGGDNVLRAFAEQLGTRDEKEFVARGGHRLWVSPEDVRTYAPDNSAVEYEITKSSALRVVNPARAPWYVRKEMTISLATGEAAAEIIHTITNEGEGPIAIASWGLTVMQPGGIEIIPQPPLGSHGAEFLPNRIIVPWTYTDLSDDRWRFGRHFIFLEPKPGRPATKIGLSHRERWVAYALPTVVFVKSVAYEEGAAYPDLGCNFETFSKDDFIELETLSPIKQLAPGQSIGHTETWRLFSTDGLPGTHDESALARWFSPFIANLGSLST
jgi:hypothetical protein